jgi:hypothetical protein
MAGFDDLLGKINETCRWQDSIDKKLLQASSNLEKSSFELINRHYRDRMAQL